MSPRKDGCVGMTTLVDVLEQSLDSGSHEYQRLVRRSMLQLPDALGVCRQSCNSWQCVRGDDHNLSGLKAGQQFMPLKHH